MIYKILISVKILFYRTKFFLKVLANLKINQKKNKYLNYLKKKGCIVLENYFSNKECAKIIKNIDRFLKKETKKLFLSGDMADLRIFKSENIDQKQKLFHKDDNLKLIGEQYLNTNLQNAYTMTGLLKKTKNNLGSGGGWHKDSINPCFKAMIYLTDVKQVENGAFQIIRKSNYIKNIIKDYFFLKHYNLLKTRFKKKDIDRLIRHRKYRINSIKAKAGTVILFDCSNLHRGAPIKTKQKRYALTNYYFPIKDVDREVKKIKKYI